MDLTFCTDYCAERSWQLTCFAVGIGGVLGGLVGWWARGGQR